MAEAVAAIGLAASITSLIDLSAKIVSQLHAFASTTTDVPETFRSLAHRLPLLITTVQSIESQAQAGGLRDEVATALQPRVQSTAAQAFILERHLAQVTPLIDATQTDRIDEVLRGLTKDGKICTAAEKVLQDIDFLVLPQTTQDAETDNQIPDALAKIQLGQAPAKAPTIPAASVYPNVSAHDHSQVHLGNIYHFHPIQESKGIQAYGLCWGKAPLLDVDHFVGRADELDRMNRVLRPGQATVEQRRLVLGGLGGIGKTQLAIAYARRHQSLYSSTFWINANSESTLAASLRSIAQLLITTSELKDLDDQGILQAVLRWLSDTRNTQWLLIFDNYDDPESYSIERYLPNIGHGSIIVTTRLPDLVKGQQMPQVRVLPIHDVDESLEILRTRSQRDNVKHDPNARHLVERLAGLPLALATAGSYLSKTTVTFEQYLDAYERRFNVSPRRPIQLQEYHRTLFTTWDLSYSRLEQEDELAARTLKLLAYFDNQQIWYDLLHAGLNHDSPDWLRDVAADHIDFENVMGTLVDFCLVEVHPATRSYSMHNCVHDWISAELNETIDLHIYWYVFESVTTCVIEHDWRTLREVRHNRLVLHALRLVSIGRQQTALLKMSDLRRLGQAVWIAQLMGQQTHLGTAVWMYEQVLIKYEKILGPDHQSTLDILVCLGIVYRQQGNLDHAKLLYERAAAGYEKVLGLDHASTLVALDNLGLLYHEQGNKEKARELLGRVLSERERVLGPGHVQTLTSVNNVGVLYLKEGRLTDAEKLLQRALVGRKRLLGLNDTTTLSAYHNLGNVYDKQGRFSEAEQMYVQALSGYEKLIGPDHYLTLDAVYDLGILYAHQGNLEKAELLVRQALVGREKALGRDHISTLNTLSALGTICRRQGKLDEAQRVYEQALEGKEKTTGAEHISTLRARYGLGILYARQKKFEEAEQALRRVLDGEEKILGLDHASTLETVHSLGQVYSDQGKLDRAIETFARVLNTHQGGDLKERWGRTVDDLCEVLALSIKANEDAQLSVRCHIACLIRLIEKWEHFRPNKLYWLARALLWIKDEENFCIACSRVPAVICNNCGQTTEFDQGYHVCIQCKSTDLCNECMVRYTDGSLTLPGCEGHNYYDVPAVISASPNTAERHTQMDMRTWMEGLKEKYPSTDCQESICDNIMES